MFQTGQEQRKGAFFTEPGVGKRVEKNSGWRTVAAIGVQHIHSHRTQNMQLYSVVDKSHSALLYSEPEPELEPTLGSEAAAQEQSRHGPTAQL